MPTLEQVEGLGGTKVRADDYWLYNSKWYIDNPTTRVTIYSFITKYVKPNGSISETYWKNDTSAKYVYPVIKIDTPLFFRNANYYDDTFKYFVNGDVLKPVYKDTVNEKKVEIKDLVISNYKIELSASNLATGTNQGLAGALESHYRGTNSIVSYAYIGGSTSGTSNGEIKFGASDTSGGLPVVPNLGAGDYTIHLFNQGNMGSIDYAGEYTDLNIGLDNYYKITKFKNSGDATYDNLTIIGGIEFSGDDTSNLKVNKCFVWQYVAGIVPSDSDKLLNIESINSGGWVRMGGGFSVANPTATDASRQLTLTDNSSLFFSPKNDMELFGVNNGTMNMSLDLHSLYLEKGTTFTINGNLTARGEVLLNGNSTADTLTIAGTLDAGKLTVNGTLKVVDGAVNGDTFLYKDSSLELTTDSKQLELKKSLTAQVDANITGTGSSDKVIIGEKLIAYGKVNFTDVDVEVGNYMYAVGDINARELTVKNYLDLANGNAQSGTIDTLVFGESGKIAAYSFDVGMDKFTITTSASGIVKLVPKYGIALSDGGTVDVFTTTAGSFDNLTLQDARVTDIVNKKTYLLKQDETNKGKLNVKATTHNAVVNFLDTNAPKPMDKGEIAKVLFVTNKDGGKGSTTAIGNVVRLQNVDGNSRVEETYDDAYVSEKTGEARRTGDTIAVSNISLQGGSIAVDYTGGVYVDKNSYISLLVGEGNLPEDYFAYGKVANVDRSSSGTAIANLGNVITGASALTFFNEYGNGNSYVGKFSVLQGTLKADASKNLIYTIAADKVAQDIKVGKDNVVELTGTGTLAKNITGEGKVLVNGDVTADGGKMQADFETASDKTMNIDGGIVKGSLNGDFKLIASTSFSGKSLQGKITSSSADTSSSAEKLKLNNDVQINAELEIANLDGNGKTLDMRQTTGTVSYDKLTIGKLWGDANLAIDVGKLNPAFTNFTADQIVLNSVDTGKKITLNAINLIDDPNISAGFISIGEVVTGSAKENVEIPGDLRVYGSNVYTASLDNGSLKLTYVSANTEGFKGFLKNVYNASYTFGDIVILGGEGDLDAVITGSDDGNIENLTKTVFMNGKKLNGWGNNTKNGIIVNGTKQHTLSMANGEITNFATAFKVENGGTLVLENVKLWGNTTDVINDGMLNIKGIVTMDNLRSDGANGGTVVLLNNATLNLHGVFQYVQTFKGEGSLNFMENAAVKVQNLGTADDNLAITIAENKTLRLLINPPSPGATSILYSPISGAGKIEIENTGSNPFETNASNLQVDVVNNSILKLASTATGNLAKNITGNGSLEFAQHARVYGDVEQSTITVDEEKAVDVYGTLTATTITNKGSIMIDAGNIQGNITNDGSGSYDVSGATMDKGAVYLYNSGTEASKTLTKTITNGKVFVMNDVISALGNLDTGTTDNAGVYLAGGTNLTLKESGVNTVSIKIKGYEALGSQYAGAGTGTLITDGYYIATLGMVQVPLENRGTMNLNKATGGELIADMSKMTNIVNSGTLNIGVDIYLNKNITNSGIFNIANNSKLLNSTLTNSGTVNMAEGASFEGTAKVVGGKLILGKDIVFGNANIEGLAELNVDNAKYNFTINLSDELSMDIIDADKVTGTLKFGTITVGTAPTSTKWILGESRQAKYVRDNPGNTVKVEETVTVTSDGFQYIFTQATNANNSPKFGFLNIQKNEGYTLPQVITNYEDTSVTPHYYAGNVGSYTLIKDYTATEDLGTLTRPESSTPRELTINGNGFVFDGGGKQGVTVVNAGDVLNFNNISEIKNWNSYVVTNDGGTVNFNNVTKLSSPVINTSGTVNFSGTTEVDSTLSGSGTFNNNGFLTVADVSNLDTTVSELKNMGIVNIGNSTDQTLGTKITGGILEIAGNIKVEAAAKLAVNEIDVAEEKGLTITGGGTLGDTSEEMAIANLGSLNLTINTNNAFIAGGIVNINSDMTTTQSILADEINLDTHKLTVTGAEDTTEFVFGEINANDGSELNITKGKVTAYDEINSKIILGTNVDLTIAADSIKKSVEIGSNANLNLGDGTLKHDTITSNSGTVKFLGNVKLDTSGGNLSLPKATFANGSTTTLTVTAGENAPLQVTNTISVDSGAKLFVSGATKGGTFNIVSGNAVTTDFTGWTLSNIRGRDAEGKHLVKGESFSVDSNVYSIVFKTAVPENSDIANVLEKADGTPLMDWAEKVCDYFDTAYGDAGEAYTANAINSMASASVLAGAQKGAATMVTQVAGNISANVGVGSRAILSGVRGQVSGVRNVSADVNDAASMRIDTVEQGKASEVMPTEYKDKVYDKQVWASYIHSKQKIDGLKTGSLTQNSTIQLNGVTVGADLWSGKKSFGGLAITYADGNANSSQMSNSTKNEAKYYGISMYHRQDMGKYALTTDIGYTYNKNDITQHTTGITDEVTSKPKTHAYTVGMKLEREIYLSKACKIVPFAGARYTRLQNRDFSNSLGANTKVDNQNLVTVPVGLSFHSHLITTEGWKLGSILEGGYEWNFGNRHSTQEFGYGGAYNSIGFDVVDRGQYFVKAALTADYQNMFFELGYRYSKGKSVRDNKWNFNANFIF